MSQNLNLAIDLSAVDNASGVFRTVGSVIQNLASGNIMGAVVTAGKAVTGALTDCVKAASDLQQQTSQTAQVIKSTGDASGMSAQQIADLADNLSKVTPFSRDVTQSGENLLLTFTNIGKDVFPQATQAMLDISQAMGQSVSSSAVQLGKALNDPAKGLSALQRIGVTFSDSEKEQIKTMMAHNDIIGAQKVMLGELSKEFGGSAQAAGQTFAGQLAILKNNLEDVKAKIGTALLPVLSNLVGGITNDVLPAFGQFGHYLSLFDLTPITYAWKQFTGAVRELLSPLNASSDVMGMLAPHLVDMRNLFSQFLVAGIRDIAGIITGIANALKGVAESINIENISSVSDAFKQFEPPLRNIASLLAGQFKEAVSFIGSSLKSVGEWIRSSVLPAIQAAMPGFTQLGLAILNVVPFLLRIREIGMQLIEGFLTHVAPILGFIIPPLIQFAGILAGALAGAINTIVSIGNGLIDFFQHNQTAMNALLAVLGSVALLVAVSFIPALIAMGVTIFTTMIPAFAAWAIGAISAGIATLIAFWPIILVAALVAAAIFIVIEVIQHWGQIGAWLQSAWKAVATFLIGVWNGIVAGVKAAWNFIVQAVKIGVTVLLAVLFAPIIAIAALFIWLYQHNTYFKQLVDAIVNFFKACIAWIMSAWQAASAWLVGAWNDVVKFATAIWTKVSTTINTYFWAAIAYVQAIWNKISAFFVNAWNTYIAGPLTTLWTNVSNVFANAWNTYVAGPLGTLWNNMVNMVNGWAASATQWGINLIQGFINGILGMIGNVGAAVAQIAAKVAAFLGFHSPAKEGPGTELDLWPKNMVASFAKGIEAGLPQVQAALNVIAQPLAILGSPQTPTAAAGPVASSSSGDNNIAIHVHLDGSAGTNAQKHGKDIADVVKKELAKHLRQQSIAPRYTSGGTHS